MGCCSSHDHHQEYDDRDDDDDDVLVYPINGVRRQTAPVIVTQQPPVVTTRTQSSFLVLDPSSLHRQTVTTSSSTHVRPAPVASSRTSRVQANSSRIVRGNCEACGQSDHLKADCRYRNRLCFYCREEGHIISVCPNKRRKGQQGRGRGRAGQRRSKF